MWQENFDASIPIGMAIDGVLMYPEVAESNATQDSCKGVQIDSFGYGYRSVSPCIIVDESSNKSKIIGILADGSPLYYTLEEVIDLDTCGGKLDIHGDYGYYTWPSCWNSMLPISTAVSANIVTFCQPGYYLRHDEFMLCPKGFYCRGCERIPCDAGTFGPHTGLAECSECLSGFFCPLGTVEPHPCGDQSFYCPSGSPSRYITAPGYMSLPAGSPSSAMNYTSVNGINKIAQIPAPPGTYAQNGIAILCPGGTYNSLSGQSFCNQTCPPASVCPEGTSEPEPLRAGLYSGQHGLTSHDDANLCPAGYYCPQSSIEPMPLPAGVYSSELGLSDTTQAVMCPMGYVCPAASSNPIECAMATSVLKELVGEVDIESIDVFYCPINSAAPSVAGAGFYTLPENITTRYKIDICGPGYFCTGDGTKRKCPAGKYGKSSGLSDEECDGNCEPGHYCESGATTATQHLCGGPEVYCPIGSSIPKRVGKGNYSSTSYMTFEVADSLPLSAALNNARTSSPDRRATQLVCEPGYYCIDGTRRPCPAGTYGSSWGLANIECDGKVPEGMFSPAGSVEAVPVEAGYYCRNGGCTTSKGQGQCAAGYYCPAGSSSPTGRPCCDARQDDITGLTFKFNSSGSVDLVSLVSRDGNPAPGIARDIVDWHRHDIFAPRCEFLYCPAGSSEPQLVEPGHFTVGGNRTTRIQQRKCDSSDTRPLLFDDLRRPYCPFSTRRHGENNLLGPFQLTGIDRLARPAFAAWQTPLFLGLPGPYEWPETPSLDDVLSSDEYYLSSLLLNKQIERLQSTDPFLYYI